MQRRIGPWRTLLLGSVALGTAFALSGMALATSSGPRGAAARQQARINYIRTHGGRPSATNTPNDGDLAGQFAQYAFERTAPAASVSGEALVNAQRQAAALPQAGGAWQEFTTAPYNAQPSNYTDPFWSNVGAGFSLVGGRVTALATTPDGDWFAGTAGGGVWRSGDQGQHWTPVFDSMPSLAIGALAVDPADGSLWAGTGEANLSIDSYAGTGVYRSTDDGATWQRVGDTASGNPLTSHTVFRIAFDPAGNAYAATDNGLFRFAAGSSHWAEVLDPAGSVDNPPLDQQVTDVAVVPGSNGQDVIAAIGGAGAGRGNTQNNGFYESTDGGLTFSPVTPNGNINPRDIGRTTFAYSADGSKLYAIVQSPAAQNAGAASVLQGIFVASGSPASVTGPWKLIANAKTLTASGCTDSACSWANVFDTGAGHAVTALSSANGGKIIYAAWVAAGGNPGPGFASGIATNFGGTWHQLNVSGLPNRYIAGMTVDPKNPAHAYAIFNGYSRRWIPGGGVGHVFETTNGGQSWTNISGNLPDIASDALVLSHGQLALATDQGVFTARAGQGAATAWSRLGSGLPNAAVDDLTAGPGGFIYAATHGRGVWRIAF